MKIRKQEYALCALFSALNIFCPKVSLDDLRDLMKLYSINSRLGLTIPEENMILGEFTNHELMLVPERLDYTTKLKFEDHSSLFLVSKDFDKDAYCAYALTVQGKFQMHRIWILYQYKSPIIVIDTEYEETKNISGFKELLNTYDVVGVFSLYSVPRKQTCLLRKEKILHLLDK
jgi:hypothetical protein